MKALINQIRRCWASLVGVPVLWFISNEGKRIERIPIPHPDLPLWLVTDYYLTFPANNRRWGWVEGYEPSEW